MMDMPRPTRIEGKAQDPARLLVIGAGAWGTTIAQLLAGNGHQVTLWMRDPAQAAELTTDRVNRRRLPGVRLDPRLEFSSDPAASSRGVEAAFVAVPSRHVTEVLARFPQLPALVSCTKGFAGDGLERITQVMQRGQPQAQVAALSGPNLAGEIAAGKPAAAVAASVDSPDATAGEPLHSRIQRWLQCSTFRVYSSNDLAGVEIGGALKNVIALAAGICDGLELGDNTKATIITRGLHELVRLGTLLGGNRETFYGLSGLGDIVATCSGPQSRNFLAGSRIARGESVQALEAEGLTAEGVVTVQRVVAYARQHGLDLPISQEVHAVISENQPPAAAIRSLMDRSSKPEASVY